MSNAAKHRKKASEFEQLKQIDRAIASYVKAIEESEAEGEDIDVALYNKVGDLALRQGRVPDAITYYERAVEHYATSGRFNNAIALCNKILRGAPGRANVYFTLGRISARKGLRGDATRNFLEYATRMQQEGRIEEGIRALAEVLDLMPELNDVRTMVEDLAMRSGIALPRRLTPLRAEQIPTPASSPVLRDQRSQDLVFLDIDYGDSSRSLAALRTPTPVAQITAVPPAPEAPGALAGLPLLDIGTVPAVDATTGGGETTSFEIDLLDALPIELETTALVGDVVAGPVAPTLDGLEANGDFGAPAGTSILEGFTSDEPTVTPDALDLAVLASDVTWQMPIETVAESTAVDGVIPEEFENATVDPRVTNLVYSETPAFVPAIILDAVIEDSIIELEPAEKPFLIEQLDVEGVPELDDAIAAGRDLVARAEAEASAKQSAEVSCEASAALGLNVTPLAAMVVNLHDGEEPLPPIRPPFRLDPHDFILPGELPPLLLSDDVVDAGLAMAAPDAPRRDAEPDTALPAVSAPLESVPMLELAAEVTDVTVEPAEIPFSAAATASLGGMDLADALFDEAYVDGNGESVDASSDRSVSVTPSLPIAAVAEAAASVASSRRDSLRAAVARLPRNWLLRRRLAEALFEAGERDAALHELETAQQGLFNDGEFASASDIADELVQVSPDRVAYHQKRVELAVCSNDQQRQRRAYLDLADALVRFGEEARARAVYVRVLELDPHDDRARAGLGAAAPPPPAVPLRTDDEQFIDLAEWLRDDDEPVDTRMRMREPAISGDEQADFDALLRHFKKGVSRSLGENDFESHYDLGVAYKEMGLLDDAVAEFQKALRSRTHRLPAYEALGQCFVEQERFQVAATVLSRALHEPGMDDEMRVGVLYLLGYSCEALQRKDEARGYFHRVYATDINFRDVAARLAAIEQASR